MGVMVLADGTVIGFRHSFCSFRLTGLLLGLLEPQPVAPQTPRQGADSRPGCHNLEPGSAATLVQYSSTSYQTELENASPSQRTIVQFKPEGDDEDVFSDTSMIPLVRSIVFWLQLQHSRIYFLEIGLWRSDVDTTDGKHKPTSRVAGSWSDGDRFSGK